MFHEEKPTTVRLQKNRAERRQENMKHILPILTAALFGAATFVFAQTNTVKTDFENYSVNFSAYDNSNNEGQGLGGYYTIKMKGEGSLYITNFFNPALSTGLSGQSELLTNPLYGITHYGYIDSTGNKHEYAISDTRITEQFDGYSYSGWVEDPVNHPNTGGYLGTVTVPRDGYFLGNFTDGQEIQVYLARKDAEGNVIAWTATNTPQETNDTAYVSRWGGRTDAAQFRHRCFNHERYSRNNRRHCRFSAPRRNSDRSDRRSFRPRILVCPPQKNHCRLIRSRCMCF